jgi:hypothetical protein
VCRCGTSSPGLPSSLPQGPRALLPAARFRPGSAPSPAGDPRSPGPSLVRVWGFLPRGAMFAGGSSSFAGDLLPDPVLSGTSFWPTSHQAGGAWEASARPSDRSRCFPPLVIAGGSCRQWSGGGNAAGWNCHFDSCSRPLWARVHSWGGYFLPSSVCPMGCPTWLPACRAGEAAVLTPGGFPPFLLPSPFFLLSSFSLLDPPCCCSSAPRLTDARMGAPSPPLSPRPPLPWGSPLLLLAGLDAG